MSIHASGQMYPEIIYILSQNKSYVRAIDFGEHLVYSKPSASGAKQCYELKQPCMKSETPPLMIHWITSGGACSAVIRSGG